LIRQALQDLAHAAGLSLRWRDYRGQEREVSVDSLRRILGALELPAGTEEQTRDSRRRLEEEAAAPGLLVLNAGAPQPLPESIARNGAARLLDEQGTPSDLDLERDGHGRLLLPALSPGYYELEAGGRRVQLAAAPARCYGVDQAAGDKRRLWGVAAQIYALRSRGDGGIGNFTGLGELACAAAGHGADAVAISPVHALFAGDVEHYSPYAPSSRLFLNALHVDPAADFGAARIKAIVERLGLRESLKQFETLELIDWSQAATAKLAVLRALHAEVADSLEQGRSRLARDYRGFLTAGGERLREHAAFEALHGERSGRDPAQRYWRHWPEALRQPGAAVSAYAEEHPRDVGFHLFLQWLAQRGLAGAQAAAREAGMRVGLIADLAVGTAASGSRVWAHPGEVLAGLSIGAPPDLLNRHGQNWGLTAFSPRALQQQAFAPYLETLRASLRHAGGLRIDHVMSLSRLWLIPDGGQPEDGAYLGYPMQELLRLLALESQRHRAVIIGEDLGTVPEGFRAQIAGAGILGMQVLWFERDHGYFVEPSRWSADAMATTTTHDLPSVVGWWSERDLDWQAKLKLLSQDSEAAERAERARDRRALWDAFVHAGAASGAVPQPQEPGRVADAALGFVARTPSPLVLAPLEDLAGAPEQPNIPGTVEQHPNWRRRWPYEAKTMLSDAETRRRMGIIDEARRRD
jgi:4-alpha-glucanotransferase